MVKMVGGGTCPSRSLHILLLVLLSQLLPARGVANPNDAVTSFLHWAGDEGITMPGAEIFSAGEGRGYGLRASRDLVVRPPAPTARYLQTAKVAVDRNPRAKRRLPQYLTTCRSYAYPLAFAARGGNLPFRPESGWRPSR